MNDYFPQDNGIGVRIGNGVKQVLQIIANRFIADNPPIPVKYYLRSSRNFHISEDYMDEIALHKKMPELVPEQYVYAWAKLSVPQAGPFNFRFSAFGPVKAVCWNWKVRFCWQMVEKSRGFMQDHLQKIRF